jgi:hypothetical protein
MKQPNLKGLGLKQNKLIYRMAKENLVIRIVMDHYTMKSEIRLEDYSGSDWLENIPNWLFISLRKRDVFTSSEWIPCLRITVASYKLKPKVLTMIGVSPVELQSAQVSDTTGDDSSNADD